MPRTDSTRTILDLSPLSPLTLNSAIFREELCYKLVLEGINQARRAKAEMAKDGKEPMFSWRNLQSKLAILRQVC